MTSRSAPYALSTIVAITMLVSPYPLPPAAAITPRAVTSPHALSATATAERVAGANRYDTAVEVSKHTYTTAETVVIATGASFPDALAGAPLAYAHRAPLLLTQRDALPTSVYNEITRLRVKRAIILGSETVVGPGVVASLLSMGIPPASITRLAGADRYGTAATIALALKAKNGTAPRIVLATGTNFPDAVAAAGFAARAGAPILLTRPADLPAATRDALAALKPTSTIVLGSHAAVADSVAAAFPAPMRLAGPDRYATAVKVAEYAATQGFTYHTLFVATGTNFPDALAAGPWAAASGAPIVLLVAPTSVPPSTDAFVRANDSFIQRFILVGGTPAISDDVRNSLLGQPSLSEIVDAMKRIAFENSASVAIADVISVRTARDSTGRWWASGTVIPVRADIYDRGRIYIYKAGGQWVLDEFGTDVQPEDLPVDVRDSLWSL